MEHDEHIEIVEDPVEEEDERINALFPKEMLWTPFSFSEVNPSAKYDEVCPTGGPGGFMCCEGCSRKYSSFLNKTAGDLEAHRLNSERREVKDIIQFIQNTRKGLGVAVENAKSKLPPLASNW